MFSILSSGATQRGCWAEPGFTNSKYGVSDLQRCHCKCFGKKPCGLWPESLFFFYFFNCPQLWINECKLAALPMRQVIKRDEGLLEGRWGESQEGLEAGGGSWNKRRGGGRMQCLEWKHFSLIKTNVRRMGVIVFGENRIDGSAQQGRFTAQFLMEDRVSYLQRWWCSASLQERSGDNK